MKREGSIERREDVAEVDLSPSDVRKKLSKRAQPVCRLRPSKSSDVDPSEIPPPPAKEGECVYQSCNIQMQQFIKYGYNVHCIFIHCKQVQATL